MNNIKTFSLTGPNGALPDYFIEQLHELKKEGHHGALDFVALLDQYLQSIFKKAIDQKKADYGASLVIQSINPLKHLNSQSTSILTSLLLQKPLSTHHLKKFIQHYLNLQCEIITFAQSRVKVNSSNLTKLKTNNSQLKKSASLVKSCYLQHSAIEIQFYFESITHYNQFLPNTILAIQFNQLLLHILPINLSFKISRHLPRRQRPVAKLSATHCHLGWTTWIKKNQNGQD